MRKVLLLILVCLSLNSYAQQISLSGSVTDTSEDESLSNALICLIRDSDSVLVSFTRSMKDGSFSFPDVEPQKYQVLITYPGYADYVDFFDAKQGIKGNLGKIFLTKKSELLETVIVRQKIAAMRMKGDTLVYKADSFAVREGASVEELLKQLPGIQVDRNGVITAQGEKVNKLLVDGEEFFSDDPAVVTQNLGANVVKDVEVFDKKSEQSDFTGIDDGERTKTINLTLKPEMKKGYFGKATLSGGTREVYNNDLMVNMFKGSRKISAFGITANTGRGGLDWQDRNKFGSEITPEYDEENGYFYYMGGGDDFERELRGDQGLPSTWTGGLHFSDKWDADKKHLNANYRVLKRNMRSESINLSQYILPDTQYFNTQAQKAYSSRIRNQLTGIYDIKLDSLSSLKVNVSGNMSSSENYSFRDSRSLNADSGLVNSNQRTLNSTGEKKNFNAGLIWRKKFRLPGRTLSVNLNAESNNDDLDGVMQSGTDFYNEFGDIDSSENIDQHKINTSSSAAVQTSVVYTEPLSKTTFLSFNYNFRLSDNEASRNSFNKSAPDGKYDDRDSLFSNDFRFLYNSHTAGADFKINKKKLMVTVGSAASFAAFDQTDLIKDQKTNYSFVNFFPKAIITWKEGPYKRLSFRYNGRTSQPSLDQLQPVRENTDPLNLQIGNPDLRQQFQHSFNLSFNNYKVLTGSGFSAYLYSNITQNGITSSVNVDPGGKTTTRFINMNGNQNTGISGGYNKSFKDIKINIYGGLQANFGRNMNMVNGLRNANDNQSYSAYLSVSKNEEKKYSIYFQPGLSYVYSRSSIRPDVVTKYLSSGSEAGAWVQLPWKLELNSNASINLREKTDVFDRNMNSVKWDASIGRKFFKKNNGELKLSAFDILDQNIGFTRTATSNFITENSYNSLRRYFMLSFILNISKTPGTTAP